jgi:formylglycine-generating enzyme required for sulfatase activity
MDKEFLSNYCGWVGQVYPEKVLVSEIEALRSFLSSIQPGQDDSDPLAIGVLLFDRPSRARQSVHVQFVDLRDRHSVEQSFVDLPLFDLYHKLLTILEPLSTNSRGSPLVRDVSAALAEKKFYEYPGVAVREALRLFLARQDYGSPSIARIVLADDWLRFENLAVRQGDIDRIFTILFGCSMKESLQHIQHELQDNVSYRSFNRLGLEYDTNFVMLFRRNPASPIRMNTFSIVTSAAALTPVVVNVPAGRFWLGSLPDDFEAPENTKPGREVYLSDYQIGRYPITNAEYACFVGETGYASPEHWSGPLPPPGLGDHPVVNVSHLDAQTYCRWLADTTGSLWRLPTEAEWEKAARGLLPNKTYVWGAEWRSSACNSSELERDATTSVYEFEHVNCSPFGVVDLAGNVWEWTSSWYEPYPSSTHGSLSYGQNYRVVRGGSYHNPGKDARISIRGRYKPDVRRPYLGFRVVLEPSASLGEPTTTRKMQPLDVVTARRILVERFSAEEMRDLYADLRIDYEILPHSTKHELARELMMHCQRHDRMAELSELIQRLRPDLM